MQSHKQKTIEQFNAHYNCAQAVLLGYGAQFALPEHTLARLGAGFGGGIVGTGNMCGAVNAAIMLLGLKYGQKSPNDIDDKRKTVAAIKDFLAELSKNHQSNNCRDILSEGGAAHPMHSPKCAMLLEEICDYLDSNL